MENHYFHQPRHLFSHKTLTLITTLLAIGLLIYHVQLTPSEYTTSIIDIESYPLGTVLDRGQIFTYYTDGEERLDVVESYPDGPQLMQVHFQPSERYLGVGITTNISIPIESKLTFQYRFLSPPPYFQMDIEDGSTGHRGEVYSAVIYSPSPEWDTMEIPFEQFRKNTNQFPAIDSDGVFDTDGIKQVAFTIPPRSHTTILEFKDLRFVTHTKNRLVLAILGLYVVTGLFTIRRRQNKAIRTNSSGVTFCWSESGSLILFFLVLALAASVNLHPDSETSPMWAGMYGSMLCMVLADCYFKLGERKGRIQPFRYFVILSIFIGLRVIPNEVTLTPLLIACYIPIIQRNNRQLLFCTTVFVFITIGLIGYFYTISILKELMALFIAATCAVLLTELQQLQSASAASERAASLYENLFEKSSDAIYILDREGVIQSANEGLALLLGIPHHQLKGRKIQDFIESCGRIANDTHPVDRSHQFRQYELRLLPKNNAIKTLLVNERTVFDGEIPIGTQNIARDITTQKSIEEALRKSEQLYRDAIQVAGAVPYYYNYRQSRYEFIGSGIQNLTGYSSEEISPTVLHSTIVEQIPLRGDSPSIPKEKPFWRADFRIRTRDGNERWLANAAIQVQDDSGKAIGILGTLQDITERKLAEMELRRLATAVEQTGDMIAITDTNGIITYVNPSYTQTTGFTSEEIVGQRMKFHAEPKENERIFRDMWSCVSRGDVWNGRWGAEKKNGTHFDVEATLSPLYDPSGAIYSLVAVMHDNTKEALLEAQLLQSQKMEAIGQLAGGVAHDFNNVLAAILGFTEMAMNQVDQGNPLYNDLEQVYKAGERASTLTRQLLTFSRRQLIQPSAIDINELIRDIVKLLMRLIGEHIQLDLQLDTQPAVVYADKGEIEQVIMNLCLNARDAMPDGGAITINTTCIQSDRLPDDFTQSRSGSSIVRLTVSDTGCGIPANLRERIFEPFFTTKAMGTGLGLATVYGIVKRHRGTIGLTSREGNGSTFTIDLPSYNVQAGSTPTPASVSMKRGDETLLLAEDDATLRKLVVRVLEENGYTVIVATDGNDAIQRFAENADRIQMVILEMIMPGLNGKKVFEQIREMNPQIPALFSTGYSNESLDDLEFDGTVDLIRKPYPLSVLLQHVRTLLDRRSETHLSIHSNDESISDRITQ